MTRPAHESIPDFLALLLIRQQRSLRMNSSLDLEIGHSYQPIQK